VEGAHHSLRVVAVAVKTQRHPRQLCCARSIAQTRRETRRPYQNRSAQRMRFALGDHGRFPEPGVALTQMATHIPKSNQRRDETEVQVDRLAFSRPAQRGP
jgi:hypothetical protein